MIESQLNPAPTNRIQLLRRMPAFGGLKAEALEIILAASRDVTVQAGGFFVREGEPGDSLFVLETGTVLIQRTWEDTTIELGQLSDGDCFGEMSLIDFQARSASVKAVSDCQAIEIPFSALRALLQEDVEQYAMIMMNLGREVSRRLRAAHQRLFEQQMLVDFPDRHAV